MIITLLTCVFMGKKKDDSKFNETQKAEEKHFLSWYKYI